LAKDLIRDTMLVKLVGGEDRAVHAEAASDFLGNDLLVTLQKKKIFFSEKCEEKKER